MKAAKRPWPTELFETARKAAHALGERERIAEISGREEGIMTTLERASRRFIEENEVMDAKTLPKVRMLKRPAAYKP